jgi:hypothetical protein
MNGVRVVGVGPTLTAAVPGDSLVRVYGDVTLWHQSGNLHKLTVRDGAVIEAVVPSNSHEYRVGMAAFSDEGD